MRTNILNNLKVLGLWTIIELQFNNFVKDIKLMQKQG